MKLLGWPALANRSPHARPWRINHSARSRVNSEPLSSSNLAWAHLVLHPMLWGCRVLPVTEREEDQSPCIDKADLTAIMVSSGWRAQMSPAF